MENWRDRVSLQRLLTNSDKVGAGAARRREGRMEGREEGRKDGRIGRGRLSLLHFSCDVASSPNLVSRPLAVSASPAAAANAAASVVVAAAAAGSKRSDSTTKTNPSLYYNGTGALSFVTWPNETPDFGGEARRGLERL